VNSHFPTTGIFNKASIVYIWGNPLDFSLSPFFQEHALCLSGRRIIYRIFRGEKEKFIELLNDPQCIGANITVPFKKEALSICRIITARGKKAGSINTIFKKNGKLAGDCTDGVGLFRWLSLKGMALKQISILGNGGSSMAISSALKEKSIEITIFGRNEKGWEKKIGSYEDIKHWKRNGLTINTTPFEINEPNVINIGYTFGNISEDAAGMLAFQGYEAAKNWVGNKLITEELFVKNVFLHRSAQMNIFLISKLAGLI